MKKGQIIENVELTGISADGKSVGKINGVVVFVRDGAPGDIVDVQVTKKHRKFLAGFPVRFRKHSKDRTEPFCDHFGVCGGCKWQHISYQVQLDHKQVHVEDNLQKISGIPLPETRSIIGSNDTRFYRNKLEFTFSNNRWLTRDEIESGKDLDRNALGFHIPKMFDKILNIDTCHLQADPSNDIRRALKAFGDEKGLSFYDIRNQRGLLRNLIIRLTSTDELMVIVQFGEDEPEHVKMVMEHLKGTFPSIDALFYVINEKKNDTFYDLPLVLYHGKDHIEETMGDLTFRIGPKSFYQTNSKQAEVLYNLVAEYASIGPDDVVYDLYTGTGTIANFLARRAKKVVGIESVPEAVEDARVNSTINNINNTHFYAGDMRDMLSEGFFEQNGRPDVIITDPPRVGMHDKVVAALNHSKAKRIVYVSCNPATQARDLALLGEQYDVDIVQPVDMFPHTSHVENIVLLTLKSNA